MTSISPCADEEHNMIPMDPPVSSQATENSPDPPKDSNPHPVEKPETDHTEVMEVTEHETMETVAMDTAPVDPPPDSVKNADTESDMEVATETEESDVGKDFEIVPETSTPIASSAGKKPGVTKPGLKVKPGVKSQDVTKSPAKPGLKGVTKKETATPKKVTSKLSSYINPPKKVKSKDNVQGNEASAGKGTKPSPAVKKVTNSSLTSVRKTSSASRISMSNSSLSRATTKPTKTDLNSSQRSVSDPPDTDPKKPKRNPPKSKWSNVVSQIDSGKKTTPARAGSTPSKPNSAINSAKSTITSRISTRRESAVAAKDTTDSKPKFSRKYSSPARLTPRSVRSKEAISPEPPRTDSRMSSASDVSGIGLSSSHGSGMSSILGSSSASSESANLINMRIIITDVISIKASSHRFYQMQPNPALMTVMHTLWFHNFTVHVDSLHYAFPLYFAELKKPGNKTTVALKKHERSSSAESDSRVGVKQPSWFYLVRIPAIQSIFFSLRVKIFLSGPS